MNPRISDRGQTSKLDMLEHGGHSPSSMWCKEQKEWCKEDSVK